jgi:starch synthase
VQEGKTGFLFPTADIESMLVCLHRALTAYTSPQWERFQRSGMQEDFSWPRFAAQYAQLYRSLTSN